MAKDKKTNTLISHGLVAQNKKARHDYFIEDSVEAGLVLAGAEVKSLRHGRANITESYAGPADGELILYNAHIPQYTAGSHFTPDARRPRKLLLKKREIDRLLGAIGKKGATLVPLRLYFNNRGFAKVELGLATGKRQVDKRETVKKRDWERQKARILRNQE